MKSDKRWLLYPQQLELSQKIGQSLNVPAPVAQVLLNRNILSLSQAKLFVEPRITSAGFNTDHQDSAAQILYDALKAKKKIVILGDYDADGMTSTALFKTVMQELGFSVSIFIPHRFEDGYGLGQHLADRFVEKNVDLLVTLDCGITNVSEIDFLRKHNVDVIVLDHHTIPDPEPNASAILNPKYYADTHPLYDLCTVGIVYKFLKAFCASFFTDYDIDQHLDLVAIGTVADVVNLRGENRGMVQKGLAILNRSPRLGLKCLIQEAKLEGKPITGTDIGFVIGPILNAAGRISSGLLGVELLTQTHEPSAKQLAKKLVIMNQKRKALGQDILKEATELVEAEDDTPVIVMASRQWHPGIIGITASQIARQFSRPTVLIGYNETLGRGSARSIGEINIFELLKACSSHFTKFGGHKAAAGFSLLPENIDAFKSDLVAMCKQSLTSKDLQDILYIDAKLDLSDCDLQFIQQTFSLSPFGQGNPEPVFYTDQLKAVDSRLVGDGKHLKVSFIDKTGRYPIEAIGFGLSDKLPVLHKQQVECVFHVDINTWNGQSNPQLKLLDIK